MKIAICLYDINNPGGIINHTEQLGHGLMELGHTVELLQLCWKDKVFDQKKDLTGFGRSVFGMPVHQGKGWCFPRENRVRYKGNMHRENARKRLDKFDLVIWTVPVPTKNKSNAGNMDWPSLYDIEPTQIFVIHDGNLTKMYPHISVALDEARDAYLACVHPCAYHSAASVRGPRALLLNPQAPRPKQPRLLGWKARNRGFLSLQTFKAWKRCHELVEAVAYMNPVGDEEFRFLAGGGIEHNYLTSKDKCKPQYFHGAGTPWVGKKFWDVALDHGMKWLGYIETDHRDDILYQARLLIDPSWSNSYAKTGDHFNRVVVDAMRMGAVPMARPLGISTNLEGIGEIFKPHENYWPIPQHFNGMQYAEEIHAADDMSDSQYRKFRQANDELLEKFDRTRIARQYMDLSWGHDTGWYGKIEDAQEHSQAVKQGTDKIITEFFS